MQNLASMKNLAKKATIDTEAVVILNSSLNEVKWLGQATIKLLVDNGIKTTDDLRSAPIEKIKSILKNPMSLRQVNTYLGVPNT